MKSSFNLQGRLRFSRFVHLFHRDGVVAVYHALSQETVFLQEEIARLIRKFINPIPPSNLLSSLPRRRDQQTLLHLIRFLTKAKIVVPPDYDEDSELEEVQRRYHIGQPIISIIYLLLTDRCNFACSYCVIENAIPQGHRFSQMSPRTIRKGLDLFAQCLADNPVDPQQKMVIFYGGEPLLNRRGFFAALEYIAALQERGILPSDLQKTLNTNGSLISGEVAKAIVEHGINVSISIDGPAALHDECRKYRSGRGTFYAALRGFRKLREIGAKVSVSCTIGGHNIATLSSEVFPWIVQELGVQGLGFNLLCDSPDYRLSSEEYVGQATEAIIEAFQIGRQLGVYEDRMMRKINAFVNGMVHPADCAGCGRQLVISPDGKVGVCSAFTGSKEYFVGDVEGGFNPFMDEVFIEWSKRSPLMIPQCMKCEALGICGGGCVYNAKLLHGTIWGIDPRFCIHSKRVLNWMIWDLHDQEPIHS